jgi:hypothetical protein
VNSKEVIVIIVTVIGSVVGGDAIDINAPKRIGENKQLLLDQNKVLDKMLQNQEALIEKGCQSRLAESAPK